MTVPPIQAPPPAANIAPPPQSAITATTMKRFAQETQTDTTNSRTAPLPTGRYTVIVLRNGREVARLPWIIEPGHTYTIGKVSSDGPVDVNLRGLFEDLKLEKACARHQAEVFWREHNIFIKTVGENKIRRETSGGIKIEISSTYCWSVDEELILPGK